jgi:hypothetical protein
MATQHHGTGRARRRPWGQFRLRTLLIATPLLGLLLLVILEGDPYRWKARNHDAAVWMNLKNARTMREWPTSHPVEKADCLRLAQQAEARAAYHQAMSQKYWRLAGRPWLWLSVAPDPPPPP